jgi:hypothetical protein
MGRRTGNTTVVKNLQDALGKFLADHRHNAERVTPSGKSLNQKTMNRGAGVAIVFLRASS